MPSSLVNHLVGGVFYPQKIREHAYILEDHNPKQDRQCNSYTTNQSYFTPFVESGQSFLISAFPLERIIKIITARQSVEWRCPKLALDWMN